jgi:phosphoserine phosphatase RsbU/P
VTINTTPASFQDRRSSFVPRPVLVVDDSKAQRRILQMQLTRWGYEVSEAASGEEALALCQAKHFDIILSDWMMPGMSGLEFCKLFRALPREAYGYFVLLTSKSEKAEIADGLEHGADDFVSKPVNADELRARLRSGTRILSMQDELVEKNRLVSSTLGKLQDMYDSLDRDLIEARKLQQTLVRDRFRDFGAGTAALMLRPSGHVGGDLVGSFVIDDDRIAVYAVDVSGHGVASAMMTARLAGLLSGGSADQNIALKTTPDGHKDAWQPADVAARLNRMMLEDIQVDQYFTLAYAEINLLTGAACLVQAGHPHPVLLHKNGHIEELGAGGLPIGLIAEASFQQIAFTLHPGDRLFLVSDGVTECPNPMGEELGAQGMIALLRQNQQLESPQLLEALLWDLNSFAGGQDLPDDVSGLIFDYRGAV